MAVYDHAKIRFTIIQGTLARQLIIIVFFQGTDFRHASEWLLAQPGGLTLGFALRLVNFLSPVHIIFCENIAENLYTEQRRRRIERKCADTIGTVLVPRAGHFQC